MDAFIASIIASGPAEKRPPHIVFESVLLVMSYPPSAEEVKMKLSKATLGAVVAVVIAVGVIYALQGPSANPEVTSTIEKPLLEPLREGSMKKLVFSEAPKPVASVTFTDPDGGEHQLSDWNGKYALVNFWATWCAPCRKEMPALDALQSEFGGDQFEVVTIATGRNPLPAITRFFDEIGVKSLPVLLDPNQKLAREMAVLGLPVTVLLNPDGFEIARLRGDADWHSDSARAIIAALIHPIR